MFSLFCEYVHLEYECIYAICRVHQAEYVIHILVAASHEYVNTYSARRFGRVGQGCIEIDRQMRRRSLWCGVDDMLTPTGYSPPTQQPIWPTCSRPLSEKKKIGRQIDRYSEMDT